MCSEPLPLPPLPKLDFSFPPRAVAARAATRTGSNGCGVLATGPADAQRARFRASTDVWEAVLYRPASATRFRPSVRPPLAMRLLLLAWKSLSLSPQALKHVSPKPLAALPCSSAAAVAACASAVLSSPGAFRCAASPACVAASHARNTDWGVTSLAYRLPLPHERETGPPSPRMVLRHSRARSSR
jgi:hypothetical protein